MQSQTLWRRSGSENIHLAQGQTRPKRRTRNLPGESDKSSSTPLPSSRVLQAILHRRVRVHPVAGGYSEHPGNWLLKTRTRIRVFQIVQGYLPLKSPKSTTRTTRSGRTYFVLTVHTSRKSTRTCDNNSSVSHKTKWTTSMCVR